MFGVSVFALIFDNNRRVLFCHRVDYNLWNLPGGRLERNEGPFKGLAREVKEEIGVDVEVGDLVNVYYRPNQDNFALTFICQVISGKLRPSVECDNVMYFRVEDIPKNTIPTHVRRVKDAFKALGSNRTPAEPKVKIEIDHTLPEIVGALGQSKKT